MKKFLTVLFFSIYLNGIASAYINQPLDFTIKKLESGRGGTTILVVGGIQGDEPGGFNAAALLATKYKVTYGNIWIVPNLNFISIINRSRGIFGDLNRKFAKIDTDDPEYETIQKIKQLILNKKVDILLHLHDGSGFFRDKYIDDMHNPYRWGQSVIIDQENIENKNYGELNNIAENIIHEVNFKIGYGEQAYHINNTKTRMGNVEMSKTLTYFAIKNLKPAFGIEASKNFPTHTRVYYHLTAIEAFMNYFKIGYSRDFDLTEEGVSAQISGDNISISLFNKRILLPLKNAREAIRYVPLKKDSNIEFTANSPIVAIVKNGGCFDVFYGNNNIVSLYPQYFNYDESKYLSGIEVEIDGKMRNVKYGSILDVKNDFKIMPLKDCRVNVIGFVKKGEPDETDILIKKTDIIDRFSIDKSGLIYRVEAYHNDEFLGMILVKFKDSASS